MADIDVGQFSEALNDKADRDLNNTQPLADYVIESKYPTAEDPTWYRLYKSGWVEQGGVKDTDNGNNVKITVDLVKKMADGNYYVNILPLEEYSNWPNWYMGNGAYRTVDDFSFWKQYCNKFSWEVKGMSAQVQS